MDDQHPGRVEDYTNANMVLVFVNLLWIFGVIWAQWGLGAVVVLAAILNHLITRLEAEVHRRRMRHAPRRAKMGQPQSDGS